MNTFKKVVLSGTPHERGVTYGRECRELIDRTIGDYERYFNNKPNLSWDYAIQMAAKFIPAIEAFAPELMEEMHGIAEGCGRSLTKYLPSTAAASCCALKDRTTTGTIRMRRNVPA